MYEKFYGFNEKPFQIVPNPSYLYRSPKHEKALTYMEYGLSENVGFILLTGEIGSGKTTLVHYIMNNLARDTKAAIIFNTNVSAELLLQMILNELEIPSQDINKADALDRINEFLIEKYTEIKNVLLIIDEAQNLSIEALEEVRMLSNLHTEEQALIQIMLVGQPELIEKLQHREMLQFSQRIAVSFHLEGLDREETGEYIEYRLEKAGGPVNIFSPEAVDTIFRVSGGIPRSINLMCQAALVYGFADEIEIVDKEIIDQILADKIGIGLETNLHPPKESKPTDSTAKNAKQVCPRLRELESEVERLRTQLISQIDELENKAAKTEKEMADRFNQLQEDEQMRNAELLDKYNRLLMRYEALDSGQKRLSEDAEHTP